MRKQADYVATTSNPFFPRKCGTLEERFWSKVVPEPNTGCWIWCGDTNGAYGSFGIYDKKTRTRRNEYAHRFSFRLHKGEIPKRLQIDHACRVKLCVNPDHLRLVTPAENSRLAGWNSGQFQPQTHCKRGHPLSGNNLGFDWRGHAKCRLCARLFTNTRRPYVPRAVRIAVLLRQCAERGVEPIRRDQHIDGDYIKALQTLLFGTENVHLDHSPALVNRKFNEDLGVYSPDANDPRFLVYRTVEEHRIKTYVRGLGAQRSDLGQRRYLKRVARNRAKARFTSGTDKLTAKRKWPRRKLRKAINPKWRWPKRKFPSKRLGR